MLNIIVFFITLVKGKFFILTKSKENLLLLINTIFWSKNNIMLKKM